MTNTDEHAEALRKAADGYRRAKKKADQIMVEPRQNLADTIRAAYAAGMRKSDILRSTEHVWSRQWVDETIRTSTDEPDA